MEKKQEETKIININHSTVSTSTEAKLKAEMILLQRKYIRLEQKEKRIQVNKIIINCLTMHIFV